MISLNELNITIIGLGLMGGSLAGALQGKCRQVCGIDRNPTTIDIALQKNILDQGFTQINHKITHADLIILATPVKTIIHYLGILAEMNELKCVVMDLGSTKSQIVDAMQQLPENMDPIGGHPMCGKEKAGIMYADSDLFRGEKFFLTPLQRTTENAKEIARAIVNTIGAIPIEIAPDQHDLTAASISHLPHVVACCLMNVVQQQSLINPHIWNMAAGGLRDTSRLAGSDPEMMFDMLSTNREFLTAALDDFEANLAKFRAALNNDEVELRGIIQAAHNARKGHYL
jgi:prephenate dehydrogenase